MVTINIPLGRLSPFASAEMPGLYPSLSLPDLYQILPLS
ncbi:MAG: hypothetical protein CLLPBCKN_002279 [Chroococcidiopsis cubana SAG 39.79]|nr:hypothetical protein [Chroococcidiopsis cubana SAG 39.79]